MAMLVLKHQWSVVYSMYLDYDKQRGSVSFIAHLFNKRDISDGGAMGNISMVIQQLPLLFHTAFVFGLLLFCVFCTYISFLLSRCSNPKLQAVYGPKTYPVVGSLFSFWKKRGSGVLLEWYAQMLANSPTQTIVVERLGGARTVVTANPANVEHILKTQFDNYPKGEPFTAILQDLLGNGIFNSDGDAWRLQRKVASYHFTSRSLRNFSGKAVAEVTGRLLSILHHASQRGNCLDLQDVLQRSAFDTICRVAFGVEPDPASLDVTLPVSDFARALDVATELCAKRATAPISLLWKIKKKLNVGSEKRLSEAVRVVQDFATDVIRRRRREMMAAATPTCIEHDLLSRFVQALGTNVVPNDDDVTEHFLRDTVICFILAGRDTTSAALTWFFWLLSSHPKVEEAIYKDISDLVAARKFQDPENLKPSGALQFSYEELQSMNYLHGAICESMRLYPPVPFDSKHALHDDVLPDGTFVGKGNRVTYHPYAMGRMETVWGPDCLEYRPQRWLNHEGVFVPQSPFKFAVFQGGVRVCLGKEMAFIQMKYIAASVISKFRLRPLHVNPKCISTLTARMVSGLPVLVDKRIPAVGPQRGL